MPAFSPSGFNAAVPGSPTTNSPYDILINNIGKTANKSLTLNVNNGSQQLNCFDVTGQIWLHSLFGVLSDATVLTNLTGAHFDFWDGAVGVDLTESATGAVMSGFSAGSVFAKTGVQADVMSTGNSDQVRVIEPITGGKEGNSPFYGCLLSGKGGATSYVRFNYTSTDAPINAIAQIVAVYTPYPNSSFAASA